MISFTALHYNSHVLVFATETIMFFFLKSKYEDIRTLFLQGVTEENPLDILDHHPLQYYQYCKNKLHPKSCFCWHMSYDKNISFDWERSRQKLINTCLGIMIYYIMIRYLWHLWYRLRMRNWCLNPWRHLVFVPTNIMIKNCSKDGFHTCVRLHPSHITCINRMLLCTGTDMLHTVMHSAFWKPQGTEVRVHIGQVIIPIQTKLQNKEDMIEALGGANFQFPRCQKIHTSKKWCFIKYNESAFENMVAEKWLISDDCGGQISPGKLAGPVIPRASTILSYISPKQIQ